MSAADPKNDSAPDQPLTPLGKAAILHASRSGVPVLPLSEGGEEPLVPLFQATTDTAQITEWWRQWPNANVGILTGSASGILVVDVDLEAGGDKSLEVLLQESGGLPPTVEFVNNKRRLLLYLYPGERYKVAGKNLSSGLRLRADGEFIPAPPSVVGGERLTFVRQSPKAVPLPTWLLPEAEPCEVNPSEDDSEDTYSANGAYRATQETNSNTSASEANWPKPLGEDAFQGVAGQLVRLIEPHSEADPAAILIQFLVAVGNVFGRHSHFTFEADTHYPNLFAVVIGATSKGRKGVSLGRVRSILKHVDPEWERKRVMSGLSSGEGLIAAVKDSDEVEE